MPSSITYHAGIAANSFSCYLIHFHPSFLVNYHHDRFSLVGFVKGIFRRY